KVDLIDVACADVTPGALDRLDEISARRVGNNPRLRAVAATFKLRLGSQAEARDYVRFEQVAPEFRLPSRLSVIAGAVRVQTGGNNPRFAEEMIEDDEAAVKADVAIRQFEIVDRQARELRLNEILQIVAPVAKAAAQRERQIHLVEQFVAGHQAVEYLPGVAELNLQDRVGGAENRSASFGQGSRGAMLRAPWHRLGAREFAFTPRSKERKVRKGRAATN